jgi:hypothetical protein
MVPAPPRAVRPWNAVHDQPVGPRAGLHGAPWSRACLPPLACVTPGRVHTVVGARLQALQPSPGQHGAVTRMALQGVGIACIRGWGERMVQCAHHTAEAV